MPTYEYRCSSGHEFEQLQRMSEAPLDTCPQCGAPAERMLSAGGGLLFKGSGFYITDYRSDSYRKAAAAEGGGGDKGGGSDKGGGGDKGSGEKGSSGGDKASSGGEKGSGAAPKKESGGGSAAKGGE
jgi:putative FmdB family regulatory protein